MVSRKARAKCAGDRPTSCARTSTVRLASSCAYIISSARRFATVDNPPRRRAARGAQAAAWIAGGADPGAVAAEDDVPKAVGPLYLERQRLLIEIHRDVVMLSDEVVDARDVVAPRFEPEARPIERLGGNELRNVEARFDVARL